MTVRDVTPLFADTEPTLRTLYLPAAGEPRASVLMRTPYNCEHLIPQARVWAAAGFTTFIQDVRGRYGSTGDWEPYAHEADDGARTVDVLHRAGLLTDELVVAGASYGAHCALDIARYTDRLPVTLAAVIAMVPALGLWETAHAPNGEPRIFNRIGWWLEHGRGSNSHAPIARETLEELTRRAEEHGVLALLKHEPFASDDDLAHQWVRLWQTPKPTSHTWADFTTPLLVVGGLRDFFALDSLNLLRTYGGSAHSLWGPWGHGLGTELPADSHERQALRDAGGLFPPIVQWTQQHLDRRAPAGQGEAQEPASPHQLFEVASVRWRPTDVEALNDLASHIHETESSQPCHSPR